MPTKPDPYAPPRENATPPGADFPAPRAGRALRPRMLMGLGALAVILSVAVLPLAQRVDRLMVEIDPGTDYFSKSLYVAVPGFLAGLLMLLRGWVSRRR